MPKNSPESGITTHVHPLLASVDELTDAQLRRAMLQSGWSPLGLVRHLSLSDERYWFDVVMGSAQLGYWPDGAR